MDRISNLPDEIICHIVSFLSAREAAFATVLSKRWQNLYTIIAALKFDDNDMLENQGSLTDFLDGVLALPASSRIRKFSLDFESVEPARYAEVNRCLCDVLKRGLVDLEFDIILENGYSLPLEVFSCKTIVKLKLGRWFVIDFVPDNAFLPALKTLSLRSIRFYDPCGSAFQKLLSACPVLEELEIYGVDWDKWKWSHTVSSPSLRRLTIKRIDYEDFSGAVFGSITFDLPNLTFLDYVDFFPREHLTVNFGSLVEANLDVVRTVGDLITSDPTNLIKGLKTVQILILSSAETTQMFHLFCEAIPVFESLQHLSFRTVNKENCWSFFPFLVKKTPNLKVLVIEGPLHCDGNEEPNYVCECLLGYSCLWSCHMEVLVICSYIGAEDELVQLKHLLRILSCLKLVRVYVQARTDKKKLQITTDLQMLPRASVNCKIQVEFE